MGRRGWIVGAAVLLLILVAACALLAFLPWGRTYGWGLMGGPWMSGGWGMMGMMWIWPFFLLVVGVLCVAGIVWAVQLASRGGSQSAGARPASEAPLEILQRRYAGGEVSKEQFDEMRKALAQN